MDKAYRKAAEKMRVTYERGSTVLAFCTPEMEKKMKGNYTVEEIVKSMKQQYPEIWGHESWE